MENKKENNISKKLSYYLRHNLNEITNNVTSDGYVLLSDLLLHKDFVTNNISVDEIKFVVANNDKQRFKLITDESGNLMIRANQGHSISKSSKSIDQNIIYKEINEPLDYCVHGTTKKAITNILNSGLHKMSRTHIHFAFKPNAISGFRKSSDVLIYINMTRAMHDGIKFYISDNEVILCEGPINPIYFSKIEYINKKTIK